MKVTLRTKKLSNDNQSIYLDIYDKGKRKYEYLGLYLVPEVDETAKRMNANAMAKAQEIRNEFILGKHQPEKRNTQTITLMEWYDEYTRYTKEERNVSKAVFDHLHLLRQILEGFLAKRKQKHIKLTDFGRRELLAFLMYMRDWKAERRGRLSQGTMATYQQRLIAVFNMAYREGYIERNPFHLIEKQERISTVIANKQALTIEEMEKFASVTTNKPYDAEVQRAFLFGCLTGLRLSDIIDLKWTDIKDVEGHTYIVKEQIKTGKPVNVPICETAKKYLSSKHEDTHIFHLPKRTAIGKGLARLIAASGIKKAVTFHTSRHTFASLTYAATSDLATTSRLLGHSSVATTVIYVEVSMDARIEAIQMVQDVINSND